MVCTGTDVTATDAGLIGFVFGVAFASAFFATVFHQYVRNRRGP